MKIKDWYIKNFLKPMLVITLMVVVIYISFIYSITLLEKNTYMHSLRDAGSLIGSAIDSKNRKLIEVVVSQLHKSLDSQSIALCKSEQILISPSNSFVSCKAKETIFIYTQTIEIPGKIDYKIYAYINRFSSISTQIIFLLLTIFLLQSLYLYIQKNKILDQLVSPLDQSDRKSLITEINDLILEKVKYANQSAYSELAQQVAHDIRSPLSSLNMISSTLDNISEEQKNILAQSIGRINSIANDLLEKGKGNLSDPSFMDPKVNKDRNTFYLTPTIKNIISEKRAQYKGRQNIFINFNNPSNIDELTDFPKTEIERIVSNIINNSIESLMYEKGEVEVSLGKIEKFLTVTIKDNGKGIPREILSKIGQKGFSYGKEHLDQSGSGLGLYHAKKTMQEFGGELLIDSEVGVGTTVTLKIPLAD